jgi:phage-related protein (TIGR01555 family)
LLKGHDVSEKIDIKRFAEIWGPLAEQKRDAYENENSGFGGSSDPVNVSLFNVPSLLSHQCLADLYRHDWVSRKIVDMLAEDTTSKWIDVQTGDADINKATNERQDELNVKDNFQVALKWARLFGGAAIIIGAVDGRKPSQPLNEDNIREINTLTVLDRWQLWIASSFNDPLQPNFGKPELYSLQPLSRGQGYLSKLLGFVRTNKIIHASRVIRLDGNLIPDRSLITNSGWHDSVLISAHEAIKHYGIGQHSLATLFQDFVTKVFKTPGLADLILSDEGNLGLQGRLDTLNKYVSTVGLAAIGDEEEYDKKQTTVAGLDKLIDKVIDALAGATNYPRSRFFTQQLGKLAGAEQESKKYFQFAESYQECRLRDPINRMLRLLFLDKSFVTNGREPEEWEFKFNSLQVMDDNEKADVREKMSKADNAYIQNGTLSPEEVATSRFSPKGYSVETTIDLEMREEIDKPDPEEENEEENEEEEN